MTEEEQLLAAIHAAPREDTVRLAFADWLDERGAPGDADRARFIRLCVANPDAVYWARDDSPVRGGRDQAAALCAAHWRAWAAAVAAKLGQSPFVKWLTERGGQPGDDCSWAYRRGFVAVFVGTEQVVLEAWTDLFALGPIEDVRVPNLWHFGTVSWFRHCLERSSVRALWLDANTLGSDCVEHLRRAADWLARLEHVELSARNPNPAAEADLRAWLADARDLKHVTFRRG